MSDFSGPFVPGAPAGSGAALCRRSPRPPRFGMGTGGGGRSVPRSGDAGGVGCANGTHFPLSPPPCRIRPPPASTRRPATRPPLLTRRMSWRSSLRRVRASPQPALGDFSSFRAGSCSLVSPEHPSGGGGTSPDSGHGNLGQRLERVGVWHGGAWARPLWLLVPWGSIGALGQRNASLGILEQWVQVALSYRMARRWPWGHSGGPGQRRSRMCANHGVAIMGGSPLPIPGAWQRGHRTPTPATHGCPRATPSLRGATTSSPHPPGLVGARLRLPHPPPRQAQPPPLPLSLPAPHSSPS